MEKNFDKIINETDHFIRDYYKEHFSKEFRFHNIKHILKVVKAAKLIAEKEKISEEERNIIILACYFHDTGYFQDIANHEEKSKTIAIQFLKQYHLDKSIINAIMGCIDATRIPQTPKNKMERIVCDADLYHLSQKKFLKSSYKLYKEWNILGLKELEKIEYLNISLIFMKNHTYTTNFGKSYLEDRKKQNIQLLEMEIEKMKDNNNLKNQKKESKKDIKQLSSGIASMFRITGRMQINLSSIADSKSGLLISVNAIMISLIVSYILGNSNHNLLLIVPTLILLVTSLITIILAILAARPTISSGEFTRKDIENRKVNLLFFGSFYKMSLEEYDWAIREMMNDTDYLYGNMIRDQYCLGLVLAKKYKCLRWAFNVFMGGLIMASLAFILMLIIL